MLHVHGVLQKAKHIPTGWQSTLRNAQGAGNAGIGPIGLIGLMALGCVRAMLSGNSKVPGSLYLPSLCALLQPDKSVILTNLQHPYPVGGDTHFQRFCFTKITASPEITDPILPA